MRRPQAVPAADCESCGSAVSFATAATIRGNDRAMARPRTSPQPEVPGLAARRIAADILDGVLRRRSPLDEQLSGKSAHPGPGHARRPRPRADAPAGRAPCCAGSARCGICSAAFSSKGFPADAPRAETILLIGAAQILWLDVPDHAAVDLSVRLAQADRRAARYAGLVNAVLRRVTQNRARASTAPNRRATRRTGCWRAGRKHYGAETARAIAVANGHEPALDLTVKAGRRQSGPSALRGRVLPTGTVRTLAHGAISLLPGFSEGAWWVQDAAAALPARLLGDVRGLSGRRSVRGARRQDRATGARRRARHRGRPLAGAACAAARQSRAACARRPRPSPPTCWNGKPDRSTPCCSTRPAPRPAPSAAIPTCPGSRAKPTSARSTALQQRLLDRAVDLLKPGGTARLLRLLAGAGGRRAADRGLLAREPRLAPQADHRRRGVRPRRIHHAPTATCARCRSNCPTPIRAGAGSTAFTPRACCEKPAN